MKPKITLADYQRAAAQLGCSAAIIMAVAEKESAKGGFDTDGQLIKRFEPAYFKKLSGKTARTYGDAYALDANNALRATSWGQFQILGDNCEILGYANAKSMREAFDKTEIAHLNGFVNFVSRRNLTDELQRLDFAGFAKVYNGPNFRINLYDTKLATLYLKYVQLYPTLNSAVPSKKKQSLAVSYQ